MAEQKDGRSHNQPPTHDEAVKGGRHSRGGRSDKSQPDQGQGSQRQPTTDEATERGQQSRDSSKKK